MATATQAPKRPEAPTGAAWLGFGIAVRGALVAASSMLMIVGVTFLPYLGERMQQIAREQGQALPPEADRQFRLLAELPAAIGDSTNLLGGSGVVVGVLVFLAGAGLLRGSETGRRGSIVFLALDAVHSVASAVWSIALFRGPAGEWMTQLTGTGSEAVALPGWMNVLSTLVGAAFSLAISVVLLWLAARPFARAWCEARRFSAARA